jgi:molybdopterin converting factor small subunit
MVKVKLFATLREFGPKNLEIGESFSVEISENSNVEDLLVKLEIPKEYAKIIMVNGNIIQDYSQLLKSNDNISIFPPVGGGRH